MSCFIEYIFSENFTIEWHIPWLWLLENVPLKLITNWGVNLKAQSFLLRQGWSKVSIWISWSQAGAGTAEEMPIRMILQNVERQLKGDNCSWLFPSHHLPFYPLKQHLCCVITQDYIDMQILIKHPSSFHQLKAWRYPTATMASPFISLLTNCL